MYHGDREELVKSGNSIRFACHATADRVTLADGHPYRGIRSPATGEPGKLETLADAMTPADMLRRLLLDGRLDEAARLAASLPREALQDTTLRDLVTHVELVTACQADEASLPKLIMQHYMTLEESPDDLPRRLELASILLQIDDLDSALEQLLQIRRHDRGFRDDIGHRGLLALFGMLGEDHELTRRYRDRISP